MEEFSLGVRIPEEHARAWIRCVGVSGRQCCYGQGRAGGYVDSGQEHLTVVAPARKEVGTEWLLTADVGRVEHAVATAQHEFLVIAQAAISEPDARSKIVLVGVDTAAPVRGFR